MVSQGFALILMCLRPQQSDVSECTVCVFSAEPWMGLMEAVLRSLDGVLCKMNGEIWQQQDSTATHSHRDTRESELHTGYNQVS